MNTSRFLESVVGCLSHTELVELRNLIQNRLNEIKSGEIVLDDDEKRMLQSGINGCSIRAIKMLRQRCGTDLKTALDAVRTYQQEHPDK